MAVCKATNALPALYTCRVSGSRPRLSWSPATTRRADNARSPGQSPEKSSVFFFLATAIPTSGFVPVKDAAPTLQWERHSTHLGVSYRSAARLRPVLKP